jgi:putative hydrolase of the HAD superfamily
MGTIRTPLRALVLDYGEVLCAPPTVESFAPLVEIAGVPHAVFEPVYWASRSAYDRGDVDGVGYWALVGRDLGVSFDADQRARLIAADTEVWTVLDEAMLSWASEVGAAGVPLALLSNMVREIGIHLRDELHLFDGFAHVAYSYEVGAIKPDPEIYAHVLAALELEPPDVLFVDDREANVVAARALGWNAHLFRGRDGLLSELDERYEFV